LRVANIAVDRPGFIVNPTSCAVQATTAAITSTAGSTVHATSAFQAQDCSSLAFKPVFTATTSGQTSKADGASLDVKLVPPAEGPQAGAGEEANVKISKVELPKVLPSRLTTLQQACLAAVFDSNPAGCPPASRVGTATVHTPILASALTGPAYFVSHGGEAFPQLIVVLQGEGITFDLVGDTFISKKGVTSSTFNEVPDVPITSFELDLPEGPYSALSANENLCLQKSLSMPTYFTAQNGATIKQTTPIQVEGCPSTLAITSHHINGRTASVTVYAPAAGKLTLTAKGLTTRTTTVKQQGTITLTLKQTHPGHLKTTLKTTYTPTTTSRYKQTKNTPLTFKQ
jgi:hypothetical protein